MITCTSDVENRIASPVGTVAAHPSLSLANVALLFMSKLSQGREGGDFGRRREEKEEKKREGSRISEKNKRREEEGKKV